MENAPKLSAEELLNEVVALLEAEQHDTLLEQLDDLHDAEIANVLEALPPESREALWEITPAEREGEILTHLHDEARATIVDEMEHSELVAAAESMETEDLVEFLEELPGDLTESILDALDKDHRNRLETVMAYEEDTAGRLMSSDVISVREDVTLAVVLRWLRRHEKLPPHTDALMVIDENNQYLGKLEMAKVVTSTPDLLVADAMEAEAETVRASAREREVSTLFQRRDLISVAVLDEANHLLGRITIDDVVDVIREEAEHAILKSAGLDEEEDLFAPVVPSAKRRGLWLGINLVTVFVAAAVIGLFEEVLGKFVALAVLMPVVASMGGIAGSQTLTLTIRGLALDQIARSNVRWLTIKELSVGVLNGLVWSLVVAGITYFWFKDLRIAAIIAIATLLNLIAAALSGVSIPLILKRLGIDPALSGAVILTTVTDVIGFLSFLGLASVFLL